MPIKLFFDALGKRDKNLILEASKYAHGVILEEAQKLDAIGVGRIVRSNPDYKIVTLTQKQREAFKTAAKKKCKTRLLQKVLQIKE